MDSYYFTYADGDLDSLAYEIYISKITILDSGFEFFINDVIFSLCVGFGKPRFLRNETKRFYGSYRDSLFDTLKEAQRDIIKRVAIKDNLWGDYAF